MRCCIQQGLVKNVIIRFAGWLGWFGVFCCNFSLAQDGQMLSPQDLIEVRSIILSGNVAYDNRGKTCGNSGLFAGKN